MRKREATLTDIGPVFEHSGYGLLGSDFLKFAQSTQFVLPPPSTANLKVVTALNSWYCIASRARFLP